MAPQFAQCVAVNEPMRFIVAGLGWWGRTWTEVLRANPKARIVATVDPAPDSKAWSTENLGVAHFEVLEHALSEVDSDTVLVVTPPRLHAPVLFAAVKGDKHVLVEKPLAISLTEAREMLRAVEHGSGRAMVGQGYRFMDSARILRELLQRGEIGELNAIRILFRQFVPNLLENVHPIYKLQHSILLDMANHHFDLVRYVTSQEFSSVNAIEYQTPGNAFKYPSAAICQFRLASGASVLWDGDWCYRHRPTAWEGEWEIIGNEAVMYWRGEEDKIKANRFHSTISIERPGHPAEKIDYLETVIDRRVPLLDHFIDAIKNGRQPEPSVRDNLGVVRAVFGSIESLTYGREVQLNPE